MKFFLFIHFVLQSSLITLLAQFKNRIDMAIKNQRLTGILLAVATLLLIPFIAMHFTNEVNWTLSDFVAAGVLLLGTGLLIELVLRTVTTVKYRVALCAVIVVALLLIWIELAVGIFGSPIAGS